MDPKFSHFDRKAIFFGGNRTSRYRYGLQFLQFKRGAKISVKNMQFDFISSHLDAAWALGRRDNKTKPENLAVCASFCASAITRINYLFIWHSWKKSLNFSCLITPRIISNSDMWIATDVWKLVRLIKNFTYRVANRQNSHKSGRFNISTKTHWRLGRQCDKQLCTICDIW
jgi:hypothetical protein